MFTDHQWTKTGSMWVKSDRNHNLLALRLISFSWRNQELKQLESFELSTSWFPGHFALPREWWQCSGRIPEWEIQLGRAVPRGVRCCRSPMAPWAQANITIPDSPNCCSVPVSGLPRKAGRKSSTCPEERRPWAPWPWCLPCTTTNPPLSTSWTRSTPPSTSKTSPSWPFTSMWVPPAAGTECSHH